MAAVDAAMLDASRVGTPLRRVFARALGAYGDASYPNEWRFHHQGGVTGYEPREYFASDRSSEVLVAGNAVAYDPTISGTKSEDSCLVTADGLEVLTAIEGWPSIAVVVDGRPIHRPAICRME